MRFLNFISVGLTVFLMSCVFLSRGQGNLMERNAELDKKYTPDANSLFNNLLNKNNSKNIYGSSDEIVKNSIKFSVTSLIRGKALFFYERELFKGVAINIGIGKAFVDDALQKTFFGFESIGASGPSLSASDILDNSTYDGSGALVYIGIKTYFSGQMFDGSFIEFAYRHERMDYVMNSTIGGYSFLGDPSVSFYMNGFSIGYGYSLTTGRKNNSTHEFFANVGIKLFKYTRIDGISSSTGYQQSYYQTTTDQLSAHLIPSINIGYCLGFGF